MERERDGYGTVGERMRRLEGMKQKIGECGNFIAVPQTGSSPTATD